MNSVKNIGNESENFNGGNTLNTNNLIDIFEKGVSYFQPALSTVVGTVLSTLFLKKNTNQLEFEKIKAGKFNEVVDFLLDTGKMSYFEYYKCRNFLNVAKLADRYEEDFKEFKTNQKSSSLDFDWFIRFFDSVGNISNTEMQDLWARILAGEIHNKGTFSLRTLETLRNMNQEEAILFQKIAHLVLTEKNGLKFILCMSDDLGKDINEEYGLRKNEFIILEECGILSSIRSDNRIYLNKPLSGIWNSEIIIVLKYKRQDGGLNSYKYSSYSLTQSAKELLYIVDTTPNSEYLLKIGKELMKKYSGNLLITAHAIIDLAENDVIYNEVVDLLEEN